MRFRSVPAYMLTMVHRLRHPIQYEIMNQLHKLEYRSAEEIRAFQARRLEALIRYAATYIPFYRQRFQEAGYDVSGPFDPESFARIQPLTKEDIRREGPNLVTNPPGVRQYLNTSGGSTGEPVQLTQDTRYFDESRGVTRYFFRLMGVQLWDPSTVLWGSERDILQGTIGFRAKTVNALLGRQFLNSFRMTEGNMYRFVTDINHHRPVYILAYAQSVYELARFIKEKGLQVHRPEGIMTSAGTLFAGMRSVIQEVFRCPVFNRYGSREVGDIASECPAHEGLHISSVTHYVEAVDAAGRPCSPGELGELLITQLSNYSMPLIRYRIGDMGIVGDGHCSCGRNLPRLERVVGRTVDVFVAPDGSLVDGEYFTHLFYFRPYIQKFQVVQEATDSLHMYLVLRSPEQRSLWEKDRPQVEAAVRKVMGPTVRISHYLVSDIPPSPSGKYRFTISKIRT